MKKQLVKKGNDFIEKVEGRFKFDLLQSKIIALLASKTHMDDDEFKTYLFDIDQFHGNLNQKHHNYKQTVKSLKGIMSKVVTIVTPKVDKLRNILIADIHKETDQVELRFHEDVRDFFLKLKGNFTQYYLENVLKLSSKYAIRIYEWCVLKRRADRTSAALPLVSLKDFREFLDLDKNTYKVFSNFNARVLKPAEKDINENTDITIKIKTKKKGKKVIGLLITVENKEKTKKKLKEKNPLAELIGVEEKTETWYKKKISILEGIMYKQENKLGVFLYQLRNAGLKSFSDPAEQKLFKKTEYEVLCKKQDIENLKNEFAELQTEKT